MPKCLVTITLDKIPYEEFVLVTELAGMELASLASKEAVDRNKGASKQAVGEDMKPAVTKEEEKVDIMSGEIVNILSHAELPTQNIAKEEMADIKSLAKNKDGYTDST